MADELFIFLFQLVIISAFIERAVAQAKQIVRTRSIYCIGATLVSFGLVYAWNLTLVSHIVDMKPQGVLFLPGPIFDLIVSSLAIAGGASGLVSAIKKAEKGREDLSK